MISSTAALQRRTLFHLSFMKDVASIGPVLLFTLVASSPSLGAGTGAGLQVPNPPSGRFVQSGEMGFCQCTSHTDTRDTRCLTSAAACEAMCGRLYAFVPDAVLACPASSLPLIGSSTPPKK